MRIGKKKAAAKRKRDDSSVGSGEKRRKEAGSPPRYLEGVLSTLMDVPPGPFSAPLPATSSPHLPWREPPQVHPPPSYSEVGVPQFLRHDSMAAWGNPMALQQLQAPQLQQAEQEQQQLRETLPVAAALTGVFQDQFITTSEMARMPPPGMFQDDDSD